MQQNFYSRDQPAGSVQLSLVFELPGNRMPNHRREMQEYLLLFFSLLVDPRQKYSDIIIISLMSRQKYCTGVEQQTYVIRRVTLVKFCLLVKIFEIFFDQLNQWPLAYANHSFLELVSSNPCVMTDNSAAAELWVISLNHDIPV